MRTAELSRPATGRREKVAVDYSNPRSTLPAGTDCTPPAGLFDSLKSAATRCLHEVGRTARIVGEQPVRLVRYGKGLWTGHALRRDAAAARLALGVRMVAVGIDEGRLGAQIAAVDERLRRADRDLRRALEVERAELLGRLADAALEDDAPLPGADAEYRRARTCREALRGHEQRRTAGDGRAAFACATLGGLLFVLFRVLA